MNDSKLAMDYPVATGRSAFPTPPGKYMVLEKIKSGKRSATYGKIYDADGQLINGPFEGQTFKSKVLQTFVNGRLVYNNGEFNSHLFGKKLTFNR